MTYFFYYVYFEPSIANQNQMKCINNLCITITKGRPIQFGNLEFTWRSPEKDMGPVRFLGSVVFKGQYLMLDAKINGSRIKNRGEIPYMAFPVKSYC